MTQEDMPEKPSSQTFIIKDRWLRAIGKAASALRFRANNFGLTIPAREELLSIADSLSELECEILKQKQCGHQER